MKKVKLAFSSLLIAGILLSGCATDEKEAEIQTPVENEVVEADEAHVDLKSWNIEVSEYSTLEKFMTDLSKNWKEDSEYRKSYPLAESILSESTISHINYFEDEIAEKGLNKDFDELQLLAYEVVQNQEGSNYEEHVKRFEKKMKEILTKMGRNNGERYGSIGEWATALNDILSKPLNDPKLKETNNDEGFEYYLKAQKVMERFPFQLMDEGSEAEKIHSKVFLLSSQIIHSQFVRTAHLGNEGQAKEATELSDQWKPTNEDMREAFKELKQVVNDLANKSQ